MNGLYLTLCERLSQLHVRSWQCWSRRCSFFSGLFQVTKQIFRLSNPKKSRQKSAPVNSRCQTREWFLPTSASSCITVFLLILGCQLLYYCVLQFCHRQHRVGLDEAPQPLIPSRLQGNSDGKIGLTGKENKRLKNDNGRVLDEPSVYRCSKNTVSTHPRMVW